MVHCASRRTSASLETAGSLAFPWPCSKRKTMQTLDDRKQAARHWFEPLAGRIIAAFENLEAEAPPLYAGAPGRFVRTPWTRGAAEGADEGGGLMGMMRGRLFEKVGVHVSTVHGR